MRIEEEGKFCILSRSFRSYYTRRLHSKDPPVSSTD